MFGKFLFIIFSNNFLPYYLSLSYTSNNYTRTLNIVLHISRQLVIYFFIRFQFGLSSVSMIFLLLSWKENQMITIRLLSEFFTFYSIFIHLLLAFPFDRFFKSFYVSAEIFICVWILYTMMLNFMCQLKRCSNS